MAAHQTADQIVEREVRELVRRRGLDPTDGDATAVRQLIDEVVADYQERSHTANLPLLLDLAQVAKSVADRVVGVGPLQPFLGDPEVDFAAPAYLNRRAGRDGCTADRRRARGDSREALPLREGRSYEHERTFIVECLSRSAPCAKVNYMGVVLPV
jgi:hypothetical protein